MAELIAKFGFSAGVLSPKLHFRSDLEKFDLGLKNGRNFFIEYTGGASTRPGTEFIDYIEDDDQPARLVAFEFNQTISNTYLVLFTLDKIRFLQNGLYVLEAGKTITVDARPIFTVAAHGYSVGDWVKIDGRTFAISAVTLNTFTATPVSPGGVSYYKLGGINFVGMEVARIYTLTSPYPVNTLRELTFSQYRDELYISHIDYAERKLKRLAHTNWTLTTTSYDTNNNYPTNIIVAPSSVGTAGALFAVTAVDFNGNESFVDGTAVAINRLMVNYTTTAGSAHITWTAPATSVHHYRVYRSLILMDGTKAHFGMSLGFIGETLFTEFTDNNIIADFTQVPPILDTPLFGGAVTTVVVTAGGTGYNDTTRVSLTGGAGQAWRGRPIVQSGSITAVVVYNPGRDYTAPVVTFTGPGTGATATATATEITGNNPTTSTMFQQRRVRVGTTNYPATLFGSAAGKPDNYYSSGIDVSTDPYTLTLDNEQLTPIRFITAYPDGLFAFQDTGVTQIRGIDDGVLTATAAKAGLLTEEGCSLIQPIRIGRDFLYFNNTNSAVFALGPGNLPNFYTADDISIFSEHLFSDENPIVSWTWAKSPHKLLWAVRADGSMLSCTFVREQQISAWSEHTTQGFFKDVESIYENGINKVYMLVQRNILGVNRQYIERFAERRARSMDEMWAVDCALRTELTYPASDIRLSDGGGDGGVSYTPAAGNLLIIATSAIFTSSDVGKVVRVANFKATVVGFIDNTILELAVIRRIDYDFSDYDFIKDKWWPSGSWSMTAPFSSVLGLEHLMTANVEILGDGKVLPKTSVITNFAFGVGSVVLSENVSLAVVGLGFTAKLKTLPITVGNASIENRRKSVKDIAARLYNSGNLEFGDGEGDVLYPLLDRVEDDASTRTDFRTGLYEIAIASEYTLDGEILIAKSGPVDITVLGYVAEVEIGD